MRRRRVMRLAEALIMDAGYKAARFHGQAKIRKRVRLRNPKSWEFQEQWGVWIEVMPNQAGHRRSVPDGPMKRCQSQGETQ